VFGFKKVRDSLIKVLKFWKIELGGEVCPKSDDNRNRLNLYEIIFLFFLLDKGSIGCP